MDLICEIKKSEEQGKSLFCEKENIDTSIIRYNDYILPDMYDHNYYEVEFINQLIFNNCMIYSETKKEKHMKFESENDISFFEENGFEKGITLTMLKEDLDYGKKANFNVTFKHFKNEDFFEELDKLDQKEFGEIFTYDFCHRRNIRYTTCAKDKNSCFDIIGAYLNNEFVGFCSVIVSDKIIGLDDLVVESSNRHKGIGTAIMSYVAHHYKLPIYLHADNDDTPKDMYLNLGFKVVGKTYEYFKMIK